MVKPSFKQWILQSSVICLWKLWCIFLWFFDEQKNLNNSIYLNHKTFVTLYKCICCQINAFLLNKIINLNGVQNLMPFFTVLKNKIVFHLHLKIYDPNCEFPRLFWTSLDTFSDTRPSHQSESLLIDMNLDQSQQPNACEGRDFLQPHRWMICCSSRWHVTKGAIRPL